MFAEIDILNSIYQWYSNYVVNVYSVLYFVLKYYS